MIAQLRGKISVCAGDRVIIDVAGVGYEVCCSRKLISSLVVGESAVLIIHTEVREDAITLYGFLDNLEKQVFLLLKTVKGLGAKSASDVLASIETNDLLRAIGGSDITRLQAVKGVGKKTAERIVVELRDKVGSYAIGQSSHSLGDTLEVIPSSPKEEAIEALCALGFGQREARQAMDKVPADQLQALDAGELVKQALQYV